MASVGELLADATAHLREAGSESARLDAELLLAWVVGGDRTGLIAQPERVVWPEAMTRFEEAVLRRAAGEPVAYIRGLKEFFGLAFSVDRRALIPRPETELLVEAGRAAVLERLIRSDRRPDEGPVRVADVGTGSGAVAIALAVELRRRRVEPGRDVAIVATDVSPEALDLARENAVGHAVGDAVEFVEADLLPDRDADGPGIDVLLANLPYVLSSAVPELPVAASFEPSLALDGGDDGFDVIRRLLQRLPQVLTPDGVALVEIGADQGEAAPAVAAELLPGWDARVERDLGGLPRVLRLSLAGTP